MLDSVQFILLIVIIILTILLVILGVQVFLILREFRRTLVKANKVLEDAGSITENIQGPLSAISSLALGFKATSLLTVAKLVKNILSRDREHEKRSERD